MTNDTTDVSGRKCYHCDSCGRNAKRHLNNTKASLGEFCAGILRHGGNVLTLYPLRADFPRSSVAAVVLLHPDKKEIFEKETGFTLTNPPTVKLN